MLPVILITNSQIQQKQYLKKLSLKQTIEIYPENNLIKIETIRNLKKQIPLLKKETTRIIINNFDLANIQAQNSSLKLLEEASSKIEFILTVENINKILPTIQSRCQIIDLRQRNLSHTQAIDLNWSNFTVKDKQTAVEKTDRLLETAFNSIKQNYSQKKAKFIHQLLEKRYLLQENNLNPQLTLDFLLINAKNSNII